jgi:tetratricopeptide (TPR) repeat protein
MVQIEILENDFEQRVSVNTDITVTPSHNHNKIILNLMIKNESKIIERCLGKALEHVDAVSILDTGSTDNTVELCEDFLKKSGKPYRILAEPFKNFGYNRTMSFKNTQEFCKILGWDSENTYAMAVDADMNIMVSPSFKEFKLEANGYSVIQSTGRLKYHNMRVMKCSHDWKCIGGTHEYWSGSNTSKIPYEVFFIDDKGDGGSKADKFERDVRLLKADILENPKNDRAYYYLGQSLKDLGRFQEAIEMFTKRIELGGWVEEVHYAYYQIGKCYCHMNKPLEMELWMNKAFEFYPKKAEPIYFLTK